MGDTGATTAVTAAKGTATGHVPATSVACPGAGHGTTRSSRKEGRGAREVDMEVIWWRLATAAATAVAATAAVAATVAGTPTGDGARSYPTDAKRGCRAAATAADGERSAIGAFDEE